MKRWIGLTAMVLALVPVAASGQGRGDRMPGGPMMGGGGMNPIGMLLEQREEIGLTADQVTRLEALQAEWQRVADPTMERMRELRQELNDDRREMMEAARPMMENLREVTRSTMDQAMELLTDEQRAELREQRREMRPGPPGGQGGPGMRGPRGGGGGPGGGGVPGAGYRGGGAF